MGKRILALLLAFLLCVQVFSMGTMAIQDAGSPKHIP